MIRDEEFLKLHVAGDGVVWFADGDCVPVCSGAATEEFALRLRERSPLNVRMLGLPANAELLSRLYPWCRQHGGRVEVATPRLCRRPDEADTPELVLLRARQSRLPPVLGGWHVMTEVDYVTYSLITELHKAKRCTDNAINLLHRHPVWYDLQFVYGVQSEWAAWLLAFLVDPRWHVDRRHPDRSARLRNYMGLNMRHQRRLGETLQHVGATARCHTVLRTWKGEAPSPEALASSPGCFLWRIADSVGGVKGDLRASSKLLTFVRYTWLQALVAGTRYSGGHALFSPELFFRDSREIEAYAVHCARRPTQFDSASGHG